jgi:catabolite regulation protein CreA
MDFFTFGYQTHTENLGAYSSIFKLHGAQKSIVVNELTDKPPKRLPESIGITGA